MADITHVYDYRIPTEVAVAVQIMDQGVSRGTKTVVQRIVAVGKPLTVNNQRSIAVHAKNAERVRTMRKDPEYRERENARRKEARKKMKEAKETLLNVPRATCCQEKASNIEATSGIPTTI